MRKQATLITFILLTFVAVPNLAFASWWNPFSWSWFGRIVKTDTSFVVTPIVITPVTGELTATSTEVIKTEESTEIKKDNDGGLIPTNTPRTPVSTKLTPGPCDQECLEHQEFVRRNREEMMRQEAVALENERIREAKIAEQNSSTTEQAPVSIPPLYPRWRNGESVESRSDDGTQYSDSACLVQKQSYISEVDSEYLAWYGQWQSARASIDSCYASNTVPYCDKKLTEVNVEWQSKIMVTMKIYQDKLSQCAPDKRIFNDVSEVVSSPY